MFEKLLSAWKKLTSTERSRPSSSAPEAGPEDSAVPEARWLEAADPSNPFGISGCDCLAFVRSMLSSSQDPQVAARFVELRGDDGRALIGKQPEDPVEIPCNLSYAYSGEVRDGVLCKARRMEEKWDIYLYESRIYFCRSWSGTVIYVAEVSTRSQSVVMTRVVTPRSLAGDPVFAVRQVNYLCQSHLFGRAVPHPLPADFPRDLQKIALYSFSQYGHRCCFGTYEDTLDAK